MVGLAVCNLIVVAQLIVPLCCVLAIAAAVATFVAELGAVPIVLNYINVS
jgi:hypothetical protein